MKKSVFFLATLLIIILSFGCNDKFDLGRNILPNSDLLDINIIDTVEIVLTTQEALPIITSGSEFLIVGNQDDPVFGTTEASFMTQVRQTEYPEWSADAIFDSIYLFLPIDIEDDYFYGENINSPIELSIYKVTDTLNQTLYSDQDPAEYTNYDLVGQDDAYIYEEVKEIEYIVGDDTLTKNFYFYYLAVKLNNDFGQDLMDQDEDYFFNSLSFFHNIFFGLYVKTNSQNTGLYKIITDTNPGDETDSLSHTHPGMVIFYKDAEDGDSQYFNLSISSSSEHFTMFSHDYSNSEFSNQLQDETITSNYAYLQSMAGTMVKFEAPGLKNLDSIVINNAELIFKTAPSSTDIYDALDEIWLVGIDTAGTIVRFQDFYASTYQGATYEDGEYKFNVTRVIQNYIDDIYEDKYFDFYLMDLTGGASFKRSVLTNGNNSNPAKIAITYTKIK